MTTPQIAHWRDGERDRAFRRFDVQFTAPFHLLPDHAVPDTATAASKIHALVTNVSMSGLGFTSSLEVPLGTVLEVEIRVNTQQFQLPVIVSRCDMIRRSRRIVYGCGVQYVKSEAATGFIPALANYLRVCGIGKSE